MKGYNVEEHIVTTEDGYMLTLHRIPNKNLNESKAVVFLGMDWLKIPLLYVASESILTNVDSTFLSSLPGMFQCNLGNGRL